MGTLDDARCGVRTAGVGLVQGPDGRVRVEAYLTVLAAAAGEASRSKTIAIKSDSPALRARLETWGETP
mgnify:CR=1 FL=1